MVEYIPLIILIGLALFLGLLLTNLSALAGPLRPNRIKYSPYESGMDPVGTARDRFSVKFYLVAMFFILFDIELVFMYPWATQYKQLNEMGPFGFIVMLVFVVILFVGFIYLLKKGGLKWD
jgi:NADH-quinone oxidoreductase subunit A